MPSQWGSDAQRQPIYRHWLTNQQGMSVCISNYGAIVLECLVPSPAFGAINTVLSYPRLAQYLEDQAFIGAVLGRYCNRVAKGQFNLNGRKVQLTTNDRGNHLHGGHQGFHRRTWTVQDASPSHITLSLVSADDEEGYPGRLEICVQYRLDENNGLHFDWTANSDAETFVNLTNHSYFNLAGFGDIGNHQLCIHANHYTPTDSAGIPTGVIAPVEGTALDLRVPRFLQDTLNNLPNELEKFAGFDHNYAFDSSCAQRLMATLNCPESQLQLQVHSDLPGLQCYTGNHLAGTGIFGSFEGICLETQYYPDAPNQPHFPQPKVSPNQPLAHHTLFQFNALTGHVLE